MPQKKRRKANKQKENARYVSHQGEIA